jgi:hypothetical protein
MITSHTTVVADRNIATKMSGMSTEMHVRNAELVKAPSPRFDCSLKWKVRVERLFNVPRHQIARVPRVQGGWALLSVKTSASAKKKPVRPLEQRVEDLV